MPRASLPPKKLTVIALVVVSLLGSVAMLPAQMSITKIGEGAIIFGTIVAPAVGGGSITIQSNGNILYSNLTLLNDPTRQPAAFTVSGVLENGTFDIDFPTGPIYLALNGQPTTTMGIDALSFYPDKAYTGTSFTLYIGARLLVNQNQASGNYSGTFNFTVNIP